VYLDRVHLGSVDVLHSMAAGALEEVRYLGGAEAMHRLGVYHPGGVLLITTTRAP
jgi:hypothetical protein